MEKLILPICCLCLVYLLPIAGLAEATLYEGKSFVVEGDEFVITCRITNHEQLQWTRDNRILEDGKDHFTMKKEERDHEVTARLMVSSAETTHSGIYRCTPIGAGSHRLYVLSANTITANHDKENMLFGKFNNSLVLTCNTTGDRTMYEVQWEMGGKRIFSNEKTITIDPLTNSLSIKSLQKEDIGNYTCRINGTMFSDSDVDMSKTISVAVSVNVMKFPVSINHVEGETAKLHCDVKGEPVVNIVWIFEPDDGTGNRTMDPSLEERLTIKDDEKNVTNAIWELADVRMEDRGNIYCIATGPGSNNKDEEKVYLRVKDKLAALWPFLGICAEVAVLCTIIFIYEKKRNKTEMEESDTDQSPEQKNTPDHGKETDVRQRK